MVVRSLLEHFLPCSPAYLLPQKLTLFVKMEVENATEVKPKQNFQFVMNVRLPPFIFLRAIDSAIANFADSVYVLPPRARDGCIHESRCKSRPVEYICTVLIVTSHIQEECELSGSRGSANFVFRCQDCKASLRP
jgi:hypothetical protein